ncbi:MAG: hypothetical protein BWX99_02614 [Deltaproteobacteria bacterium ADurb.Bin151]|nr:MAG: hypothetical protein BWX99_02614 [Deltaproteobacteria bacterium ADurb.Bin151]
MHIPDDHTTGPPVEMAPAEHTKTHFNTRRIDDAGAVNKKAGEKNRKRRKQRQPPCAVNIVRIIGGHIEIVIAVRFDADQTLFDDHFLLIIRGEIARFVGSAAQILDHVHDFFFLIGKRVPERRRPAQVLAHHGQNFGIMTQSQHTYIPVLGLERLIEVVAGHERVVGQPSVRLRYFKRIGGGHQDLRQKCVGIQSDRGEHLCKLFVTVGTRRLGLLIFLRRRS